MYDDGPPPIVAPFPVPPRFQNQRPLPVAPPPISPPPLPEVTHLRVSFPELPLPFPKVSFRIGPCWDQRRSMHHYSPPVTPPPLSPPPLPPVTGQMDQAFPDIPVPVPLPYAIAMQEQATVDPPLLTQSMLTDGGDDLMVPEPDLPELEPNMAVPDLVMELPTKIVVPPPNYQTLISEKEYTQVGEDFPLPDASGTDSISLDSIAKELASIDLESTSLDLKSATEVVEHILHTEPEPMAIQTELLTISRTIQCHVKSNSQDIINSKPTKSIKISNNHFENNLLTSKEKFALVPVKTVTRKQFREQDSPYLPDVVNDTMLKLISLASLIRFCALQSEYKMQEELPLHIFKQLLCLKNRYNNNSFIARAKHGSNDVSFNPFRIFAGTQIII
ncbi:unnamed protein product [Meganyctiphanes norvegica]|uniref:Uncharacterized protein n=1 Tax=Meganyctiphanes norvegica TaxID=48144 RepID=A0AAV2QWN5_MEGNR